MRVANLDRGLVAHTSDHQPCNPVSQGVFPRDRIGIWIRLCSFYREGIFESPHCDLGTHDCFRSYRDSCLLQLPWSCSRHGKVMAVNRMGSPRSVQALRQARWCALQAFVHLVFTVSLVSRDFLHPWFPDRELRGLEKVMNWLASHHPASSRARM